MHIVHLISSLKMGGAERILCILAAQLAKTKHTQSVIYFHDGPLRTEIEALGIKTYYISSGFFKYDIVFILNLMKQLRALQPDVIHSALWSANFFGVFIAKLLKIPIVCAIHAQRSVEGALRNILDTLSLKQASHLITITSTIKQQLIEKKLVTPAQVTVIENSIDIQDILYKASQSTITRLSLGLNEQQFVIGSVGRFVHVKNYHFLLKSVAGLLLQYTDMRLVIIGIGPEYESLQSLARQLSIYDKVIFILGKPAYNYYTLFDCLVSASTSEALSLVLLEAMSLNVPCIVRGDHYHDLIQDGVEGLITNTAHELRQAIIKLYIDKNLAQNIGLSGAKLIQNNHSVETMVTNYQQVLSQYAKN